MQSLPQRQALALEGLTKRFGDVTAVDKVSFEVREAEVFGFLGPNGAGKTTTINRTGRTSCTAQSREPHGCLQR